MTTIIFAALVVCLLVHLVLYRLSGQIGLLEIPGGRKTHKGAIPLVGGISIYTSCIIMLLLFPFGNEAREFTLILLPIVMVGLIDDIFDISAKFRLLFQFFISFITVNMFDLQIGIFKILPETFALAGVIDLVITVFFIVTVMNAINMMDGIDGLAGSILLLSVLAIAYLQAKSVDGNTNQLISIIVPALLIFLFFNMLKNTGEYYGKVFMGDAGSMFLGFFLAINLLHTSQDFYHKETANFLSCVWFVFLPLADMLATLAGRLAKGKSPFRADRTHIHHILQRTGFHKHQVLQLLIIMHLIFIAIGIWLFYLELNFVLALSLLGLMFIAYRFLLRRLPRLIRVYVRQHKATGKVQILNNKNVNDGVSV